MRTIFVPQEPLGYPLWIFSFNPIFSVHLKDCDGGTKRIKALKNALKKETNMIKCRREVPIVGGTLLKTLTVFACLSLSFTSSQALAQNQNQDWDAQQTLDDKSFVHPPNDISEAVLAPRYLNMTLSNISANPSDMTSAGKQYNVHVISRGLQIQKHL